MVGRALRESYVLLNSEDRPAGLLRLDPLPKEFYEDRAWRVLTCKGEELFSGDIKRGHGCDGVLLPSEDTTFAWPGVERPMNVALVRLQDTGMDATDVLDLRLLDASSEVSLRAHAADACDQVH